MQKLLSGFGVIDLLKGPDSLLDATITCIQIRSTEELPSVEVEFKCRESSKYTAVKLSFSGVKEFYFYHKESYRFYNVESMKFLHLESNNIYISLDPDDCTPGHSDDDLDFILANEIELSVEFKE